MLKRDGHTHSHFCRHGSGEETELFIREAIQKGFTTYSITEHLPLPEKLLNEMPYSPGFRDSMEITTNELDDYIKEIERLQKKYRSEIQILCGFELDYLMGYEDHARALLKEYGPYLEDGLLSVHIIPGKNAMRCVDESAEDFQEGLIEHYGSYHAVQQAYYQAIGQAIRTDLGKYKPRRIGHLCLCNKYQKVLNPTGEESQATRAVARDLLLQVGQAGFELDVNVAGLYRQDCQEIYLLPWMVQLAKELKTPLIYGSDSHAIADVGRSYEEYAHLVGV